MKLKVMMPFLLIVLVVSLLLFTACTKQPEAGNTCEVEDMCAVEGKPLTLDSALTLEEARSIAENSDCVTDGSLKDTAAYNPNSRTWWIDLDLAKEGCSPACVVSEETKTAEINWRCTGLIIPGDKEKHYCLDTEKKAMVCTMEYSPVCGDDGKTYSNICMACAGGISYWVAGACDPSEDIVIPE